MKKIIFLIILISLSLIGCKDDSISSGEYKYENEESRRLELTTQSNLIIENTNGIIAITGSDTATGLSTKITKKVKSKSSRDDAQNNISNITVSISSETKDVNIKVDHPQNDDRVYEIDLEIILPNNFNFDLNLGNGDITVESITKIFVANLGNGVVNSNLTLLDTCAVVVAVGNGVIQFKVPANTNAGLTAAVGNGIISSQGLSFQNQTITDRLFSGVLGDGAGKISLNLGNGNININ